MQKFAHISVLCKSLILVCVCIQKAFKELEQYRAKYSEAVRQIATVTENYEKIRTQYLESVDLAIVCYFHFQNHYEQVEDKAVV